MKKIERNMITNLDEAVEIIDNLKVNLTEYVFGDEHSEIVRQAKLCCPELIEKAINALMQVNADYKCYLDYGVEFEEEQNND